jgi:hypothetical protein
MPHPPACRTQHTCMQHGLPCFAELVHLHEVPHPTHLHDAPACMPHLIHMSCNMVCRVLQSWCTCVKCRTQLNCMLHPAHAYATWFAMLVHLHEVPHPTHLYYSILRHSMPHPPACRTQHTCMQHGLPYVCCRAGAPA